MTGPDWDDERLDAAFHDRFDRPAPTDLAKDVHVRIAGTSPARFSRLRAGRAWSLAAAAVVVVLVAGSALVGLGGLGRTGGSPLPSDPSASAPGAIATPTEQPLPGVVFEQLSIMDVDDAIAVRDAGVDDREIAVHGWFTPPVGALRCASPVTPQTSPIQMYGCGDHYMWFSRDAESLIHRSGDQTSATEPVGPAIRPYLQDLDTSWQPTGLGSDANGDSVPTDVVFVGHFDDRRAALCPEAERTACRDRFVVDAVTQAGGAPQGRSQRNVADATSAVADIEAIVADEAPDSPILSMSVADLEAIVALEPSLWPGQHPLIDHPKVWLVRVLESERAVTYLVIDGSDAIYEMNPEGEAILVGGEPPTSEATPSPGPWPPAGARVLALTGEVAAGQPPVQVAVVDLSGRLDGVAEKGTIDPSTRTLDSRIEAYPELGVSPGRVHLVWVGSICDSQITVTVAEDVRTIFFDMGPPVDCDTIGIGRELVLDFSGLLNVSEIELVDATGRPSMIPQPGYALDCGTLDHDTCLAKAADIVAANLERSPPRRVVSIVFETLCGSFLATYDDGTASGADIDCILFTPNPS